MVTYCNDGIRCTDNCTPQLLTSTVISLFSFINQSYCSDATFLSMICFNLLCMHFNVSASAKKFHLQFFQNFTIFHFLLYEEILSGKKYLANFGAPARFHSIFITVESAVSIEKLPSQQAIDVIKRTSRKL